MNWRYCRYSSRSSLAPSLGGWQGEGALEGCLRRVVGLVMESFHPITPLRTSFAGWESCGPLLNLRRKLSIFRFWRLFRTTFGLFSLGAAVSLAGKLYFVTMKLVLRDSPDFPSTLNFQASLPEINRSIDLQFLISTGKLGVLGHEDPRLLVQGNLVAAILH